MLIILKWREIFVVVRLHTSTISRSFNEMVLTMVRLGTLPLTTLAWRHRYGNLKTHLVSKAPATSLTPFSISSHRVTVVLMSTMLILAR